MKQKKSLFSGFTCFCIDSECPLTSGESPGSGLLLARARFCRSNTEITGFTAGVQAHLRWNVQSPGIGLILSVATSLPLCWFVDEHPSLRLREFVSRACVSLAEWGAWSSGTAT
jgi:hypothetical protein